MVALSVTDLHVRIGRRRVVEGVTFTARAGELVGVLGPNGAGKSSLMRGLLGLLPSGGGIMLDDRPVAALSRAEAARRIAYLPQGQALHWPLSVERLVALGRLPHLAPFSRIGAEDEAAIRVAMETADVLPLAGRIATELSGGERARALLARALAVGAPMLLADEPLASLDPAHQLHGMEILRDQARAGVLVLAVLHDLGLAARFCDRILLLHDGRLVGDGPPADVLTPGRLARVFGITGAFDAGRLVAPLDRIR